MFDLARGARPILLVLALMTVLFAVVPGARNATTLVYNVVAIGAMATAGFGVVRNEPTRRRGWLFLIGGYCGWVFGDIVYFVEQEIWNGTMFPAPSDAVFLSAYALIATGLLLMVRTRRAGRDMTALLDATIIATGAAVVAGVFVIAPLAGDSELTLVGKLVSSAYPVGDVLLLAMLVRMWATPTAGTAAFRLLVTALGLTLTGDILWNASVIASGTALNHWANVAWLGSYVAVAAAACTPTMRALTEPAPDRDATLSSQRRLVALACGIMLPAVTLLVDGAGGGVVRWQVIGVGSILISLLVLLRMGRILHIVEVQAVQLAGLARSDALTGAPNRRTWDHELSRACATSREQGSPLCVAMIDMDHFKSFNDTNGHPAGDRLLRDAVSAWSARLGPEALLARYGGEEFAVLLPGVTLADAQTRIQSLQPVTPHGQTFSAGVCRWDPTSDPGTAVVCADLALYEAKGGGRDRVVAFGGPQATTAPVLPAFRLTINPILDTGTRTVVGHEARVRFGSSPPDAAAVLRRAHCDGHGDLLEAAILTAAMTARPHPGASVQVRASASAVASPRFWHHLPARLDGVVLQLIGDVPDQATARLLDGVRRLRSRGGRLALPGPGEDRGDLHRLAVLLPDVVTASRSLVGGCAESPRQRAVLRGLVAYADELGAATCAHGAQDPADLEVLTRVGITWAQAPALDTGALTGVASA